MARRPGSRDEFDDGRTQRGDDASIRTIKRIAISVVLGLFVLITLMNCYFVTDPNEVSSVTYLGSLVRGPLGPGFHLKLPYLEGAYTIKTSKQNLNIKHVVGKTSNNQTVTFDDMNITWHIEKHNANKAMFKVGDIGTQGIVENFAPIIEDRALRVLGQYTTVDINAKKNQIVNQIMAEADGPILKMFGVTIDSIQIPGVNYDPVFEKSVAAAVEAQNKTVRAEADLRTIQIEARQAEAQAEGRARAKVEQAQADAQAVEVAAKANAQATLMNAQANAKAAKLMGQADASALAAKVAAMGGAKAYNQNLMATALSRWNGSVPQMVYGGAGGSPSAYLPLPMPELGKRSHASR